MTAPPDDILVILRCPKCGETWHAATIRPGAWWSSGASAEKVAKQCYCRRCEHPPPMEIVADEAQGRLF